jgi:hypothetical protein
MARTSAVLDLYRHMEWADAAVWGATLAAPGAADDERLRELLHHVHVVQRAFLRAWRGESLDEPFPTFDDLESIVPWARSYYPEAYAHIGGLSDEDAARPLPRWWRRASAARLPRRPSARRRSRCRCTPSTTGGR